MSNQIEKLTPEQEQIMFQVRDEWTDRAFSCRHELDREKATEFVKWLYKSSGLEEPQVHFTLSMDAMQLKANELMGNAKPQYIKTSSYGNMSDYGWVAFYDFFTRIGVINDENFNTYCEGIKSGFMDMIQLEGHAIMCEFPKFIKRNTQGLMHSAKGPAVEFKDGTKYYFWNGANVPEMWIERPEEITHEIVAGETNAERRRILTEILGFKKFYELWANGYEMRVMDETVDNQGNKMTLYAVYDPTIEGDLQFLHVVCPPTMREYTLCPPNQNAKTAEEAKIDTFGEKYAYRHGDVALVPLDGILPEVPFET